LPTSAIFKTITIEEKLAAAEALVASASAERDDLRATVEKLTVGSASEVEALKLRPPSRTPRSSTSRPPSPPLPSRSKN
jgi:hypothetical protein